MDQISLMTRNKVAGRIEYAMPGVSSRPLLWIAFIGYVLVFGYTMIHHEPWGDEVHSWNIAKASVSYSDLIFNSRYEGHPPTWYTIMWTISKFSHDYSYVQLVHAVIAALVVFAVLFFSPFPVFVRLMIPFGYYFLYEYAVLSRNYAIGVLAAVCLCIVMRKSFRFKWPVYYFLLLVMSNTHLLSLMLAGCLHLYLLLFTLEKNRSLKSVAVHAIVGALIFLSAIYFITPPSDSQLNTQFWMERWSMDNIKQVGQAPLRSFVPIPAWWQYNTWNTQFLLDASNKSIILNFFIALAIIGMSFVILWRNKKSLVVFITNLLLSVLVAILVFPLTSGRYAGFVFIGFMIAFWLYCYEAPLTRVNKWSVAFILSIQIIAAGIFVVKDIRYPFSNAYRVKELIALVPHGEKMVTDYWALNPVSTFTDGSFYCIDLQKEVSFLQWGPQIGAMLKKPNRYLDGVKNYFLQNRITSLYLISQNNSELLFRTDPKLANSYRVELVSGIEGAIEKGGNLYLYKISEP